MKLYPYQKEIVDQSLSYLAEHNQLMITIPTGGGKTVVFSHIIKSMNLKTLVVAHTIELITQCRNTLRKIGAKNVEVMTIQKCYMQIDQIDDYDFLIIDECHRSCSVSYLKLIDKFKDKKLLGVTASPFRSDGQWLLGIYKHKISSMNIAVMIEEGFLSDFIGYRVKTQCSIKGVKTGKGDFIASSLAPVINTSNRNELIVREYMNLALGDKTLCFGVNIQHCNDLAHEFQKHNISAFSIHGQLPKSTREKYIQDFKEGKIQVLVNCQILTEGFDEPSITCILMARPTLSKVLYMQMIGRGSRLYPGKDHCKIIEFTDNNYDVSNIEQLIFPTITHDVTRSRIKDGEKLTEFYRKEKDVYESSGKTEVERFSVIQPTFFARPATDWQKKFLSKLSLPFQETITEFEANELIRKVTA